MVDTATFWVFTAGYVAITLFLAYYGWKKTKSSEDFLLAGKNVSPWVIGLSYGSTFISTSAIVGFGGVAAQLGMGLMWLVFLNIALGILIAFVVFGKPTRRLGQKLKAMTFPDLIGKRYNSHFMQYATGILILISMPLYSSAVLIGGSQFINVTLNVDYNTALLGFALITAAYVVFGGLLAVMYTDAFQGGVMILGMSLILIITFSLLGGVDNAISALTALKDQPAAIAQIGSLTKGGWNGWTTMPNFGSDIWLTMVTTIIMGVGIGVLAQPQLIVRFMTAKDSKALNRAIPIGAVFILLTTGVAYTVGALTNVYFFDHNQKISTVMATTNGVLNTDKIMPLYINSGAMPDIVIVLFMLTLLAAAMSTLSSIFHTMGSAAGHDVWRHFKTTRLMPKSKRCELEECSTLRANKVGAGIMIVASVGLAFIMPPSIIARATAMFMGLCAAAFLPLFTHALFSKKVSLLAAKSSLVVGAVTWFAWTAFVHTKESSALGICKALFGSDSLLAGTSWTVVDSLVIAIPLSILALFIGWYLDKRNDRLLPELA
ncbi:MAG TPA: sodium:solute symporter family protein [Methanomassiliicoccales archaeon]|jgi:SSS family solute:Na+ symporter